MTAQLDGIASAQPTAPTPSAVYARWFPAVVQLPDATEVTDVVLVYATDAGLFVFNQRPATDADLSGVLFCSSLDWPATLAVQPSLPQPRLGFVLHTVAGPVRISPVMGCGCHLRALKNWHPSWAGRSLPWGQAA
jgi:hypothetical protein